MMNWNGRKKAIISIIAAVILIIGGFHFYQPEGGTSKEEKELLVEEIDYREVVFDRSNSLYWDIWNTGRMGYSLAAQHLRELGYKVSQSTISLEKRVDKMDDNDVLVLGPAPSSYSSYSDTEINAIEDFVKDGGGVLVLGEHDDFKGMASFQNGLLDEFDLNILSDIGIQNKGNLGNNNWIDVNSSFFGLDEISMYGAASISLSGDSGSIAEAPDAQFATSGSAVGGKSEYGEGRVACLGDTHIFWNGEENWGLRYGNNSRFLTRVINYLAEEEKKKSDPIRSDHKMFTADTMNITITAEEGIESYHIKGGEVDRLSAEGTDIRYRIRVNKDGYMVFNSSGDDKRKEFVYFFNPEGEEGDVGSRVLIDLSHGTREVHSTPSSLYRFAMDLKKKGHEVFASSEETYEGYDAVVISNPLERYTDEELQEIKDHAEKLILLGERRTSVSAENMGVYKSIKTDLGWTERKSPINQLSTEFGIELTRYTIADAEGKNFSPEVDYDGEKLQLQGCAALEVEDHDRFSLKKTGSDLWGEETSWEVWHLDYNTSDREGPVTYSAQDESVLVMGDCSPLSYQNFEDNKWLASTISGWIGK